MWIENDLEPPGLTYLTIIDNPNWPTEMQRKWILCAHLAVIWHRTSGTQNELGVGRPGRHMKSQRRCSKVLATGESWHIWLDLSNSLTICASDGLFRWAGASCGHVLLEKWMVDDSVIQMAYGMRLAIFAVSDSWLCCWVVSKFLSHSWLCAAATNWVWSIAWTWWK